MTKKITSETKRWTDWDLNDVYNKGYKDGKFKTAKQIINLFKKYSIYTGAVIEFEIKQFLRKMK